MLNLAPGGDQVCIDPHDPATHCYLDPDSPKVVPALKSKKGYFY